MSLLQLDDYFLTRLNVEFHLPDDEVDIDKHSLGLDYDVLKHETDAQLRLVKLRVKYKQLTADGSSVGYDVDCKINGQFRIPDDLSDDANKRESIVHVNGISILYSTLRGVLGGLSGSFIDGRICLPTIAPHEVAKTVQDRKRKDEEAAKKASPNKKSAKKKAAKKAVKKAIKKT
ncbi:hypothetical protein [Cerasicoccus arenae]|uniref:Preprotein translocase subunit SecB n=1 Tax=Cerasicoccus arenae TaxID=424488 RepID=A0A8J3DKV3_9BACT|nr:hypothetical protein [Cerasicoccus arenae]MBK1857772.1 hypothetical protein [Cerasicoccus arenae]GHC11967.1 hypothetical protein GCM10007047_31680 [Cerasicoccus arenae]